jgi:hypothetical protein
MPKKRSKRLNAIQLEFQRLSSNTAQTKRLQELHHSVYVAAEQSHLERKCRKAFAIVNRLQEPVPNNRDSSVCLLGNEGLAGLLDCNLESDTSLDLVRVSVKSFGV